MRRRSVPLGLALVSYAVALVQRPGVVIADTKVDLYVDPGRFLSAVTSVWSPTADLGHVFGAQYSGYAWPMGPWFAVAHALAMPTWIAQRLWLGTVLALAAWGIVRLLDALATPARGPLHAAAGLLYAINPYVTVYADRTSISLLSYAALPWLLLAVHRGLREPRAWRWPVAFALILTSTGGGVNVAVTGWLLLGPALLVVYERAWGDVGRRAVVPYLLRLGAVNAVVQLWWVIPVVVQGLAAPSFLPFSEQPGTIWSTTSLTESLRLMGFWTSYVGVGYGGVLRPFQASAPAMLQLFPVVLASLLVPGIALAAFPVTRRWRYAPLFLLLVFAGLIVMAAGWPEGTPLRLVATGAYYRVQSVQFLRTTYKAGALTAIGLAVLGGAAFAEGWRRAGGVRSRTLLAASGAALVALAAWPLVTGRALDRQLRLTVPPAWHAVAADLDRRPADRRALLVPGQLFGFGTWGGAVDPLLPSLTSHPVVTRWIVPFSDRRATDVQWAVDGLITQERMVPGQLGPLLDLLGVGDVVLAADGDRSRSGQAPAIAVADQLEGPGRLRWTRRYGPSVSVRDAPDRLRGPARMPELERAQTPTGGLVRVLPRTPGVVVDGGGDALVEMAAFGELHPGRPLRFAPDLGPAGIRSAAQQGATVVIADGNRRRAFVSSRLRGETGPTLPADESVSADGAMLDPWAGNPAFETVQVLTGVRASTAPASPQTTQFPERRPFAALDGDPSTAWMADRTLERARHRLTVTFDGPRDVPSVDLLPYSDSRGVVREVAVGGRRFRVRRGWNRLVVNLRGARSLTVAITRVSRPRDASSSAGGIREVRIPGVRVGEALRPPADAAQALQGGDLRAARLVYLLQRTTADAPFLPQRYVGERGAGLLRDAEDPELELHRIVRPPAARRFVVDGWATVSPRTPDPVLDALARGRLPAPRPAVWAASSSRYEGLGRNRASGAFDRGPRAWIGEWIPGRPAWLAWRVAHATRLRRLTLVPARVRVRRPTVATLTVDGRRAGPLPVGPGGRIVLPHAVSGRAFRLTIVAARFPAGTPAWMRQRRAVGVGEVVAAGAPRLAVPRRGRVRLPCGAARLRVGGRVVGLGAVTDRAALDAGRPIRVRACGPAVALGAGAVPVDGLGAPLRVDAARLASGAPDPRTQPGITGGRVVAAGTPTAAGGRRGVRVAVHGPAWLVLGESYDRHWRASCDGRSLGGPQPLQGYANGWPIGPACRAVRFWYAPQRAADVGFLVSLVGGVLLALVAAAEVLRRRRWPGDMAQAAWELEPPRQPHPLPLARAVALAALVASSIALAFGLRAGVVALPVMALVLWKALSDRLLGLVAAALLLIGVPAAYGIAALVHPDAGVGGDNTQYALDRIGAHWLAVAALLLLAVVLVRALRRGPAGAARRAVTALRQLPH